MRKKRLLLEEFHSIITNRKLAIAMVAILCIPILYSSMFLWAFWDPYEHLDQLPVAVINSDEGAKMNGETVQLGAEFIEQLKDIDGFSWQFVDYETAQQGLEEQIYYLSIEIPEDFSERATNVLDQPDQLAQLRYAHNESFNFLASQIGSTAVGQLKEKLSQAVTESYTKVLFENLETMADGFSQASDGASQLKEGIQKASAGSYELSSHLGNLNSKTQPLITGIKGLQVGSHDLHLGLTEAQEGVNQLHSGLATLEEKHGQLLAGAGKAVEGSEQLGQGMDSLYTATEQVTAGLDSLSQGLAQYAEGHPELMEDEAFQQLVRASQQLQGGMKELAEGQESVIQGAVSLQEGNEGLFAGITQFHEALQSATAGSVSLQQGIQQLVGGSAQLEQGTQQLVQGITPLQDGVQQLSDGAQSLTDGISELSEGSLELYNKLFDAAQESSGIEGSDTLFSAIAGPVQILDEPKYAVPNYGTGFAPYFLSLGLYVGALVLTIIYPIKEPAIAPRSGWNWFISKFVVMGLVGVIQGILAALLLLYGLKLDVQLVPAFFLLTILTSLVFMALIQCLVTVLGDTGRFVAILILILQLTTSAGTFPLELIPSFLQTFNSWLPMTYSVAGFKAAISSAQLHFYWSNTFILLGFLLGSGALTWAWLSFLHGKQKKINALSQNEQIELDTNANM